MTSKYVLYHNYILGNLCNFSLSISGYVDISWFISGDVDIS